MKKYLLFLFIIISSHAFGQTIDESEKVYKNTEVDNHGEIDKILKYVAKNFNPPDVQGIKGKVVVEFIIEKDGFISNFKVIKDIGHGTAKEAKRLFVNRIQWEPSTKDGEVVRTLYYFPITIMPVM